MLHTRRLLLVAGGGGISGALQQLLDRSIAMVDSATLGPPAERGKNGGTDRMRKIAERVGRLLGTEGCHARRLGGGDISTVYEVEVPGGDTAVAKASERARAEAEMLRALAGAGVPAPAILAVEDDLLVIERVPGHTGPGSAWDSLAQVLARLRDAGEGEYGWSEDYAFGPVALPNAANADWARFWAENRLACHLPYLPASLGKRIEAVCDGIGDLLPASPRTALLHGDLWGGNVMSLDGEITGLIDPASYRGDTEVDVAMLTMFDRPSTRFFEMLEMETGWQERQPVYRLFPLIVHFRLFGESYRARLEADLDRISV